MMIFDHYSNQTHESVEVFLRNWGSCAWDDANIPVGLFIGPKDDPEGWSATIQVYHPRKEHVKSVSMKIKSDEELQMLRNSFLGIAERLYGAAASRLERFARGDMPGQEDDSAFVLYYWHGEKENV